MTEHERDARRKERRAERDSVIGGTFDSIEQGEPDISTERLLASTADICLCDIDRVISALHRTGRFKKVSH